MSELGAQSKSLSQRILRAGVSWMPALLLTYSALSRHTVHHSAFGSVWVAAAMCWVVAGLWTWQVFRPSSPQCAIAPDMPPSIKPPTN